MYTHTNTHIHSFHAATILGGLPKSSSRAARPSEKAASAAAARSSGGVVDDELKESDEPLAKKLYRSGWQFNSAFKVKDIF
jgi:uncharacterized membrane protein YkoI